MRADTQTKPQTETEKLFALDKPSLGNLSYALRHPETWPKNFIWDYSQCDQCAMGLAHHLWGSIPKGDNILRIGASRMARAFAIPYDVASRFFFGKWPGVATRTAGYLWWKKTLVNHAVITPDMVADQIDKYLAESK